MALALEIEPHLAEEAKARMELGKCNLETDGAQGIKTRTRHLVTDGAQSHEPRTRDQVAGLVDGNHLRVMTHK